MSEYTRFVLWGKLPTGEGILGIWTSRAADLLKAGGLAAALTLAVAAPADAGCNADDYTGSICVTAGSYCPVGYMRLEGQTLPIVDYSALFSLLGCQWGGDCRSTFALPDFRGRAAIGTGQGAGLTKIELGQWRGMEGGALDSEQIATHSHPAKFAPWMTQISIQVDGSLGETPTPSPGDLLKAVSDSGSAPATGADLYGPGTGNAVPLAGIDAQFGGTVELGYTGNGAPIDIRNPSLAFLYCILTENPYPPRK